MAEREPNGDIQVLARCAQILRALEPGDRIQLGRLAADLSVGRSTLHRYLVSMANLDMVTRVGEGEYVLGPLLAQLGAVALNRDHVIEAASAAMDDLGGRLEETIVLSVWGGRGAVVTRVHAPETLIQVVVRVGSVLPVYAAQTIIFLAHSPADLTERALEDSAQHRGLVEQKIAEAKRDGFVSVTGFIEGLETLAVPLLDASGIVATLAAIGTESRLAAPRRASVVAGLLETAAGISAGLGHEGTEVRNA